MLVGQRFARGVWPIAAAAATMAVHLDWLARDETLPVGDVPAHLINVARHVDWLRGGALPFEAFPPGVYVVAAARIVLFGAAPDAPAQAIVAFAGLLAAVLAWLGLRASGWTAGVLLPLVALATPVLSASAREVLLDLPATALIVTVWACAWASDGYRRPLPTLLVGVALGAGALVKYTLFPWVLPALVLAGVGMVARSPASLLPLGLVVGPAHAVARALQARALGSLPDGRVDAVLTQLQTNSALAAAAALALMVGLPVVTHLRREKGALPGARGLQDGAGLALAALAALALVTPWFLSNMPVVWVKVHHEAIAEVRAAGLDAALHYAGAALIRSWPGGWWLLQAALVLELVWAASWVWARWRGPERGPLGPTPGVLLSCAVGMWFTARSLPVDLRYYLPLLAGGAIVLGLGASRFRIGPALGTALGALMVLQLAADRGFGPRPVRIGIQGFDPYGAYALGGRQVVAPPLPQAAPLHRAVRSFADAVAEATRGLPERSVVLVTPPFEQGRPVGLEGRGVLALIMLQGRDERLFVERGALDTQPAPGASMIAAVVPAGRLPAALALGGATPGEATYADDVAGYALRVQRISPSGAGK